MKYDFALDFTPEGVRLLQGSGDDTIVFGSVDFDDPHFDTRVEDLRKEAEEVHGGPFATALLLPHSEVLFHTMKVEEGTEIKEDSVRSELEGMTPYAIGDLAYDWKSLSKTQVEIAAVARETLAEADGFAAQHGFGPGPFSTAPNPKAFRGQPSFGASERPMPQPEPEPELEPAPLPESAPAPVPEAPGPAADLPAPKVADTPQDESAGATAETPPAAPKDTVPAPTKTEKTGAKPDAPAAAPAAESKDKPSGKSAGGAPFIDDFAEPQVARPPYRAPRSETPQPKMGEGIISAPKRASEKPKPDTAAASPSFSSRRTDSSGSGVATALGAAAAAGAAGIAGAATAATASRLGSITERAASLPDGGTGSSNGPRPDPKDAPKSKTGPVPPTRRTTAPAAPKPSGRGAAPGRVAPTPTVRKVETPDSVSGAAKSLSTAPGSANPKPPLSEAESLTVFGMRGEPKSRGSAMLPVLIGLVVAVLLAVVVWWTFLSMNDVDDTAPAVEQSSARPIDETGRDTAALEGTAPVVEAPAEDDTAVEETTEPEAEVERAAEVEPEANTNAFAQPAPTDTAALEPGPDDPLRRSQDAPEATRYAATGVSTAAPSSSETPTSDNAALEGPQGDSTIRVQDGVAALDAPEMASLAAPAPLAPPPPPGAQFDLDENGRVVATPEGAVSPQGVRITAGQPPVVPPQAPIRPAPTSDAAAPVEESRLDVPVSEGQPTAVPPQRPAGTTFVATEQAAVGPAPLARPDDIAVTRRADLDEATEDGDLSLDGPQDTTEGVVQTPSDAEVLLAALSPRARPERAIDEPEMPQISEEQSAVQAEAVAAAIASVIPGLEEATDEAVARSLRPGNRPTNFARTVEQTRQAAPVQVASASAVVTPRNPTAGAVASRATEQDTIRLNRVNLIGVYGTQSDRRALIRLPSGRFVKVKVGDRVDGGRVSAIDSDKLQYVKGGRQVVLAIPAG